MSTPDDPAPRPDAEEVWRRNQLALAVLNHRGCTAESADLARRALEGESIEALAGDR